MRPRNDDLWSTVRLVHFQHVAFDPLILVQVFSRYLLAAWQRRFRLAQVDRYRLVVDALHGPGNQLAFTVDVRAIQHVTFRFADTLQDDLFCCLRGDPPEILRRRFDQHRLADRGFRANLLGILQRDL